MKSKIILALFISTLTFLCSFGVVRVQAEELSFDGEIILSFNSYITVNTDNSIDVVENVTYNTGPQERHGIYRDIYPYSSVEYKMGIENISVVDENGLPYIFETSVSGKNFRIKIGDPDKTFSGQKIYIIKYHATRAVAQFEDFDEIYWNVTGNEWEMPIYKASVSVVLPDGAKVTQSACYYGLRGNNSECLGTINKEQVSLFAAPSVLNPVEEFTIAVGFSKGFVFPYSGLDKASSFFNIYGSVILATILPILMLVLSLIHWRKNGKDPKGTGIIVPQYDVPDRLTPLQVIGILKQKTNGESISAEIVYLATQGYIKINQKDEKKLGIFKSTDYEFLKIKDFSDLPNEFDKKLLKDLFVSGGDTVVLSDLKNIFYKTIPATNSLVMENLLLSGYYKNIGRSMSGNFWGIIGGVAILLFLVESLFNKNFLWLFLGSFVSIFIYAMVSIFFPAKSEKGVAAKEYILGLKDYLQIAEKDRLNFHNAPEDKPEIFEKLLPYAMVLGVVSIWAKEFEGIYTTPPSWYSSSSNTSFSVMNFSNSLSNFSSYASSSLSSSPSGSGGGGSSGGGGGGGGGGSW